MNIQPGTFLRALIGSGIAASIAVNLLEAQSSMVAKFVAVLAPLSLFGAVEVVAHVQTDRLAKAVVGMVGLVAGWISYWHMTELAIRYGERSDSAHVYAFAVDGMMLAATLALVGLQRNEAARRTALEAAAEAERVRAYNAADKARRDELEAAQRAEAARWDGLSAKEKVIELLTRDARQTNTTISKVVGLSDVRVGQIRREAGLAPSGARR